MNPDVAAAAAAACCDGAVVRPSALLRQQSQPINLTNKPPHSERSNWPVTSHHEMVGGSGGVSQESHTVAELASLSSVTQPLTIRTGSNSTTLTALPSTLITLSSQPHKPDGAIESSSVSMSRGGATTGATPPLTHATNCHYTDNKGVCVSGARVMGGSHAAVRVIQSNNSGSISTGGSAAAGAGVFVSTVSSTQASSLPPGLGYQLPQRHSVCAVLPASAARMLLPVNSETHNRHAHQGVVLRNSVGTAGSTLNSSSLHPATGRVAVSQCSGNMSGTGTGGMAYINMTSSSRNSLSVGRSSLAQAGVVRAACPPARLTSSAISVTPVTLHLSSTPPPPQSSLRPLHVVSMAGGGGSAAGAHLVSARAASSTVDRGEAPPSLLGGPWRAGCSVVAVTSSVAAASPAAPATAPSAAAVNSAAPARALSSFQHGARVITQSVHAPPLPVPPSMSEPGGVRGWYQNPASCGSLSSCITGSDNTASVSVTPVAKIVPQQQQQTCPDLSSTSYRGVNSGSHGGVMSPVLSRACLPGNYAGSLSHNSNTSASSSTTRLTASSSQASSSATTVVETACTSSRLSMMLDSHLLANSSPLQHQQHQHHQIMRATTSPRPSILRKRDAEFVGARSCRDLSAQLQAVVSDGVAVSSVVVPSISTFPQQRRRAYSSGHSSSTVSATSSPGEPVTDTQQQQQQQQQQQAVVMTTTCTVTTAAASTVTVSSQSAPGTPTLTPRKKPRKQNLCSAATSSMMLSFPDTSSVSMCNTVVTSSVSVAVAAAVVDTVSRATCDVLSVSDVTTTISGSTSLSASCRPIHSFFRRPVMSLLDASDSGGWDARSSHFQQYQDVRVKDDRRPTVVDISSNSKVAGNLAGWKIHHLSGQLDDLCDVERAIYRRLTELLRVSDSLSLSRREDKQLSKLNELVKSNMQRSKTSVEQLSEARSQLAQDLHQHQPLVANIVQRYARKRSIRHHKHHH